MSVDEDAEYAIGIPASVVDPEMGTSVTEGAGITVLPCKHVVARNNDWVFATMTPSACMIPVKLKWDCGHTLLVTCAEKYRLSEELGDCPFRGELCDKKICDKGIHKQVCKHSKCEPCPPCMEKVLAKLECGHEIRLPCHLDPKTFERVSCRQRCKRKRPDCLHKCRKLCYEDCGPCQGVVLRNLPGCRNQDHKEEVLCYMKYDLKKYGLRCESLTMPRPNRQNCGHENEFKVEVPCWQKGSFSQVEVNYRCAKPCDSLLFWDNTGCGHPCSGTCGECYQFRFHKRCQKPCLKILICQHQCTSTCGVACPPCSQTCDRACAHKQCDKKCGYNCRWECSEECVYKCIHGRCTKRCDEICNKVPCMEPCPEKLPCGHTCVGFCGEPCPPYCRFCNEDLLVPGALYTLGEIEDDTKFIFLEKCGHAIESAAMESWMNVELEEIGPKCCPICRTPLAFIHRFSQIILRNQDLVDRVKDQLVGSREDVEDLVEDVTMYIGWGRKDEDQLYPPFLDHVEAQLSNPDIDQQQAGFLHWIIGQWFIAKRLYNRKIDCPEFEMEVKKIKKAIVDLFEFTLKRGWPLNQAEMEAFRMEIRRLEDSTSIYDSLDDSYQKNPENFLRLFYLNGKRIQVFLDLAALLDDKSPYDNGKREMVGDMLTQLQRQVRSTLALPRKEVDEIVRAFGAGAGRWFRCPNGHIYVITECGGAMALGACPDCRATIGGRQHVVLPDNELAREMDGAEEPHYDRLVREWNRQLGPFGVQMEH